MSVADIVVERQTANDESAMVAAVHVLSGSPVERDQLLFEIESSKAVEEYHAPSAGILVHDLSPGQTVAFGHAIASITPAHEFAESGSSLNGRSRTHAPMNVTPENLPGQDAGKSTETTLPRTVVQSSHGRALPEPRFSHAAQVLLRRFNFTAADFDVDFVRASDVRRRIQLSGATSQPITSAPTAPAAASAPVTPAAKTASGQGLPLSRRKLAEIDVLSKGAGAGMLSVLGVHLGAVAIARPPGDILTHRITDLVLYEASRLIRKYPRLNASFEDGCIFLHENVHGGLALDRGGQLVVYGIENTDKADLPTIAAKISEAVARYVDDQLTVAEMSRATFTVTDLSGEELDFVLPLLPRGQSLILGITRSGEEFRLFAGFDHRVTEGREIAIFLGELRTRLQSFHTPESVPAGIAHCEFCASTAQEALSRGERGLLRVIARDGREISCCGSCWNGW